MPVAPQRHVLVQDMIKSVDALQFFAGTVDVPVVVHRRISVCAGGAKH